MKRLLIPILLLVLTALAQNVQKARDELRLTDRLIVAARPGIIESNNEEAIQTFHESEGLQKQAWNLFERRAYRLATSRTKAARLRLRRAVELAKFDPERIRLELRKTADQMNEVRPAVMRSRLPRPLELWKLAEGEQETAIRLFEQRKYRLALRFTVAARLHARRAFELVRRRGDPEKVAREVDRTGMLFERARAEARDVAVDERVVELFRKAEAWQAEAVDALHHGRLLQALKMTLAARDLLLRTREMARGKASPEMVEQALQETDRLIETWQGEIRTEGSEDACRMLDEAIAQQSRAREDFAAREFRSAWQQTSLARRILNRAIELTRSRSVDPGEEPTREN